MECRVSGPMALVLRVARIYGMAPLKFNKTHAGWLVQPLPIATFYSKIMALICCMLWITKLLLYNLNINSVKVNIDEITLDSGEYVEFLVTCSILFCGVYTSDSRMISKISCINNIHKINMDLNEYLPIRQSEKKKWLLLISTLVLGNSFTIFPFFTYLYFFYITNGSVFTCTMDICHVYLILAQFQLELVFACITLDVQSTLRHLNECLKHTVKELEQNTLKLRCETKSKIVHKLVLLYKSTCDVASQVDQDYGLLLFLCSVSLVMHLLLTMYQLLKFLQLQAYDVWTVVLVLVILYHFFGILILVEPSHRVQAEAEITHNLMNHITEVISTSENHLALQLEQFFRHLTANRAVLFSPLQLFTLNRKLLVSMLGTIVTYLVILKQY